MTTVDPVGSISKSIDDFAKLGFARIKLGDLGDNNMKHIHSHRRNYERWGAIEGDPDVHDSAVYRFPDF